MLPYGTFFLYIFIFYFTSFLPFKPLRLSIRLVVRPPFLLPSPKKCHSRIRASETTER